MKNLIIILIVLSTSSAISQVGIGTTSPDTSSILDINSTNSGILIPRLALTSTSDTATISGTEATSLLVYNTATVSDVIPGFYFWNGTEWERISSGNSSGSGWSITGNAGTTSGTNFVGTTDSQALDLRVNNVRKLRLETNGTLSTLNTGKSVYIGLEAGNADPFGTPGGKYNVAIGEYALRNNTGGLNMVAIGGDALRANTTGTRCIAIGKDALTDNISGDDNIAIGKDALDNSTIGHRNIAIGNNTLQTLSSGNGNISIGYQSNSAIATASNAITLGGFNSAGSHQVRLGNNLTTSIGGQVAWTNFSDGRFKQNVKENVPGLDFVLKLRPVSYNIDVEKISKYFKVDKLMTEHKLIDEKEKRKRKYIEYTGFIAQEVNDIANTIGYDFDGVEIPEDETKSNYGIRYALFVVPLVKAVQQQQTMINDLQKEIEKLKRK